MKHSKNKRIDETEETEKFHSWSKFQKDSFPDDGRTRSTRLLALSPVEDGLHLSGPAL